MSEELQTTLRVLLKYGVERMIDELISEPHHKINSTAASASSKPAFVNSYFDCYTDDLSEITSIDNKEEIKLLKNRVNELDKLVQDLCKSKDKPFGSKVVTAAPEPAPEPLPELVDDMICLDNIRVPRQLAGIRYASKALVDKLLAAEEAPPCAGVVSIGSHVTINGAPSEPPVIVVETETPAEATQETEVKEVAKVVQEEGVKDDEGAEEEDAEGVEEVEEGVEDAEGAEEEEVEEEEEEEEGVEDEEVEEEEVVVECVEQEEEVVEVKERVDEEGVEEEEVEEFIEIEIDGILYLTNDEENGDIYEVSDDGDLGKKVGHFENGECYFD